MRPRAWHQGRHDTTLVYCWVASYSMQQLFLSVWCAS